MKKHISLALIWYLLTPLTTHSLDYSINFLWIKKYRNNSENDYVLPSTPYKNQQNQYIDTLMTWAEKNPKSTINLWFDSAFTTPQAIVATQCAINQKVQQKSLPAITLKDIRTLKPVQENPDIFSSQVPFYFRTDIARAIIINELTLTQQKSCCIYTDFDIQPMDQKELFDSATLNTLKEYHFVMAHEENKLGFENCFQMFLYHPHLAHLLEWHIIKQNIVRCNSFLQDLQDKKHPDNIFSNIHVWEQHLLHFQENVFYSYPLMHAHYCHEQKQDTDHTTYFEDAFLKISNPGFLNAFLKNPIPTKKIHMPPSSSKKTILEKLNNAAKRTPGLFERILSQITSLYITQTTSMNQFQKNILKEYAHNILIQSQASKFFNDKIIKKR